MSYVPFQVNMSLGGHGCPTFELSIYPLFFSLPISSQYVRTVFRVEKGSFATPPFFCRWALGRGGETCFVWEMGVPPPQLIGGLLIAVFFSRGRFTNSRPSCPDLDTLTLSSWRRCRRHLIPFFQRTSHLSCDPQTRGTPREKFPAMSCVAFFPPPPPARSAHGIGGTLCIFIRL